MMHYPIGYNVIIIELWTIIFFEKYIVANIISKKCFVVYF